MPAIRDLFASDLTTFRRITGLPCTVVASHGDFINRKLGISNTEILKDHKFREKTGILREAYDKEQGRYVTCRIADQSSPDFVEEALTAIAHGEPVIYLLTHLRQWRADIPANIVDDISRAARGIRYMF